MALGRPAAAAACALFLSVVATGAARASNGAESQFRWFEGFSAWTVLDMDRAIREEVLAPTASIPRLSGNRAEKECLAKAIYFEARGEPATGRLAVGRVVLNRVLSDVYPDTICGVVYQNAERRNGCQFSFACDGKPERPTERRAWRDALDRAEKLLKCAAACPDHSPSAPLWASTHFHATYVSPGWARRMGSTGKVGQHIFYREPRV